MTNQALQPLAAVGGGVKILLRLEGLAVLLLATLCFHQLHPGWGLYFWLFFLPDIGLLGYLAGNVWGCRMYNLTHSYIIPLGLAGVCVAAHQYELLAYCAIWVAHIGFDRAFGYGLKYATSFGDTHLGKVGRRDKN